MTAASRQELPLASSPTSDIRLPVIRGICPANAARLVTTLGGACSMTLRPTQPVAPAQPIVTASPSTRRSACIPSTDCLTLTSSPRLSAAAPLQRTETGASGSRCQALPAGCPTGPQRCPRCAPRGHRKRASSQRSARLIIVRRVKMAANIPMAVQVCSLMVFSSVAAVL